MAKETIKFDAEVDKIFQLVIHSIYENKEIFLRELISNASDACDKLRYKSLTNADLLKDDSEFKITIKADKKNKTLTISDNGIGMSKAELTKNLGTIAKSGTQEFLKKVSSGKKDEAKNITQLIGQFGVGFYSSFMVAEKVTVTSQAAGTKKAYTWESKGDSSFTIEEAKESDGRGTSITLHLREEEQEYLEKFRIKHVVESYSNHIEFNIVFVDEDGSEEALNEGKAIWLKNKSEVSKKEYKEFYNSVSHLGNDDPWLTLHNKAEGVIEYTNLLFIPTEKPFDLFHPDRSTRVKLYAKRVFIAEESIDIIPSYLRFLRGVVDSEDLSLNISRETVQNNAVIHKIRKSITNKVLSELSKKADKKPEEYEKFWNNFGPVLKEGLCDGLEPRDEIINVCRFRSTASDGKLISLQEYVDRMKKDQKEIYYITSDDAETAANSPQLEGFKKDGIEVLLLTDSVDQFWVNVVHEFKQTPLKSVTRVSSDSSAESSEDNEEDKKDKKEAKTIAGKDSEIVTSFIKETLGDNIHDARVTSRLTDSPVCLSVPDGAMDIRMERFMVDNKQLAGSSAKILEINPEHPIIVNLAKDLDNKGAKNELADTVHLLFAQANIIEGEPIKNVTDFTKRLNNLLEKALAA